MKITEAFVLANQELLPVIVGITDNQWDMPVPPEMTWQPNQRLRDIVNYHTYDDAWVPDVLAGKTADEVGGRYEALRTTQDTLGEYRTHNARANEAVKGFIDLDRTTHLSYGDFTASEYLQHVTLFRGMRVFDLAHLTGQAHEPSEELVQALWDIIQPQAEALRSMGVFGPTVAVSPGASLRDQLLGLTGRQP